MSARKREKVSGSFICETAGQDAENPIAQGKEMKFRDTERLPCDVLVIGGGGAGLRSAIEAREAGAEVILVSKSRVGHANNTYIAKAVIASSGFGDPLDGSEVHLKDTVKGGRYLNDPDLVSLMAGDAREEILFLERCGIVFAKKEGRFEVSYIAGHRYARHVRGENRTGSDLVLPLKRYAQKIGVRFADKVFVTRLLSSGDRIAGATGISDDGRFLVYHAGAVILTTGGFGQAYLHTNNAAGITGDGHALAFDLGVGLKDMEFVQFYPTALGSLGSRLILYEALVLDAGAILRNASGENIAVKHGLTDVMSLTRDRLSQAIMTEILEGRGVDGGVTMDLSSIPSERLAPFRSILPANWSPDEGTLSVSPTTHFCMGGVCIDRNAETSCSGLFAAGEVCAGMHGANRLGGNALCEVFTMGGIAGKNAAGKAGAAGLPEVSEEEVALEKSRLESFFCEDGEKPKSLRRSLKENLWLKAGILRDQEGLADVLTGLENMKSARVALKSMGDLIGFLEFKNMCLTAGMVCRAALLRTESRGSHYRKDYPEEDNDNWLRNIVFRKEDGAITWESVPVKAGPIAVK